LGREGIDIVDISDPTNIKRFRLAKGPGDALNARTINGLIYVAFGFGGVSVVDPINKLEVARYKPPKYGGDYVFDIMVNGEYVFAASRNGIVVYQVLK